MVSKTALPVVISIDWPHMLKAGLPFLGLSVSKASRILYLKPRYGVVEILFASWEKSREADVVLCLSSNGSEWVFIIVAPP